MNILYKLKEFIMGRPPGSKNKPRYMEMEQSNMNQPNQVPREFNYEEELANQGLLPNWREVSATDPQPAPQPAPVSPMVTRQSPSAAYGQLNLYLIEGTVQMRPLQPGRQPIQAEQRRIVWANNIDEAIQKYSSYFSSLNTALEVYVVLNAAGSEAIR
jgi:hypothetical protein